MRIKRRERSAPMQRPREWFGGPVARIDAGAPSACVACSDRYNNLTYPSDILVFDSFGPEAEAATKCMEPLGIFVAVQSLVSLTCA
jgi:hypothetical protein